jgi:hypothetical protein
MVFIKSHLKCAKCSGKVLGHHVLGAVFAACSVVQVARIPSMTLSFFFCAVLGLEPRAFTLSHSTSPIFVNGFSR